MYLPYWGHSPTFADLTLCSISVIRTYYNSAPSHSKTKVDIEVDGYFHLTVYSLRGSLVDLVSYSIEFGNGNESFVCVGSMCLLL